MATDAEVRGHLLNVFYDLRHRNGGWVPTSDLNLAGIDSSDGQMIGTVCQHLLEAGLIDWKPLQGNEGFVVGMGRIRGHGVDVIERQASPSINIDHKNRVHTSATAHAKGLAGSFVEPSFTRVAAQGEVGGIIQDSQSWEIAAQIATRQNRHNAAVLASGGSEVFPPMPEQPVQSRLGSKRAPSEIRADGISITPTQYPVDPLDGNVVVQNFISINFDGKQFREFNASMTELLAELRRSNEISGEIREKLLAELEAGLVILKSPKPDPNLVDLLLKRPLVYVADKATGAIINTLAATALIALLKMTGWL